VQRDGGATALFKDAAQAMRLAAALPSDSDGETKALQFRDRTLNELEARLLKDTEIGQLFGPGGHLAHCLLQLVAEVAMPELSWTPQQRRFLVKRFHVDQQWAVQWMNNVPLLDAARAPKEQRPEALAYFDRLLGALDREPPGAEDTALPTTVTDRQIDDIIAAATKPPKADDVKRYVGILTDPVSRAVAQRINDERMAKGKAARWAYFTTKDNISMDTARRYFNAVEWAKKHRPELLDQPNP